MVPLGRTLVGWLVGGLAARVLGLLARLQAGPGGMHRKVRRRTFLRNAALGSAGVVTAQIVGGFIWFWWPNKTGAFGSVIPVTADQIPEVNAPPLRNVPGRFWLVHAEDGLLALYTKCPHLGCTVPWVGPPDASDAFRCPCHGSLYNYVGERTGGPAPRPMDYMAINVEENGNIGVDTGNIMTRSEYEPEQATPYPA